MTRVKSSICKKINKIKEIQKKQKLSTSTSKLSKKRFEIERQRKLSLLPKNLQKIGMPVNNRAEILFGLLTKKEGVTEADFRYIHGYRDLLSKMERLQGLKLEEINIPIQQNRYGWSTYYRIHKIKKGTRSEAIKLYKQLNKITASKKK